MIRERILSERLVSGLRTKYFPKSRVNQGLVSVAPWVNVVLLIIMFVIVDARVTLQPGVIVSLPEAPFKGGSHPGLVVVVRSVEKEGDNMRSERVFFDDQSFAVENPAQMKTLADKLATAARNKPGINVVIFADARVWNGTLIKLFNMAEEAGISQVNLAVKESGAGKQKNGAKAYEGN